MNNKSRDAALSFLQEVLVRKLIIIRKRFLFTFCSSLLLQICFIFFKVRNAKRQQLQVQERFVAADGFMLNFLSVMQHLSSKVKMGQVDVFYLHRYASSIFRQLTEKFITNFENYNYNFNSRLYNYILTSTVPNPESIFLKIQD